MIRRSVRSMCKQWASGFNYVTGLPQQKPSVTRPTHPSFLSHIFPSSSSCSAIVCLPSHARAHNGTFQGGNTRGSDGTVQRTFHPGVAEAAPDSGHRGEAGPHQPLHRSAGGRVDTVPHVTLSSGESSP